MGVTFGTELRRLRRDAGLSLTDLATRLHYSKGYLSKVETGAAQPNVALAQLCDTEFETGGHLAALLPSETPRRHRRPSVAPSRSGLPAVTRHFTGRGDELELIRAAVLRDVEGGAAVCAVHGMAGVGKTTLAVRCAHRLQAHFTDGCLFLDMRGHTPGTEEVTAAEALDRFLRLLGVPGEEIPADPDDRAALYRDRLRGRSVLIILDNARSTAHVRALIPAEPKCRMLVTSRHRMPALDDAQHIHTPTLPLDQAVALFTELTESAADTALVESVVRHCGQLPLAIRIAAAKLRANPSWSAAELERRLSTESARLGQLDDGERSIIAAFRLSYQDLPFAQRRLFGLLALHPGTDLELYSAAALANADVPSTEDLLAGLHDAHLITHQDSGRYQFHDLLRVFAGEIALAEISEEDQHAALARLLDLSVHVGHEADRILTPQRYRRELVLRQLPPAVPELDNEQDALAWLTNEWSNLVRLCALAGERGFHDRCWQLAVTLRGFFFLKKLWDPWVAMNRYALAAAEASGNLWAQATTANNLGVAEIDRGDNDHAAVHYLAALELFRRIDDGYGVHTTLNNLAWLDHYRGDHAAALEGMRTALVHYRENHSHRNVAITLRGIALVQAELGAYGSGLENAADALATFEELGLDLDAAMAHNAKGWLHYRAGMHREAALDYSEALALSTRCGSTFEAARAATGLGNIAAGAGDKELAQRHWADAAGYHPNLNPRVVGEARAQQEYRSA